MIRIIAAPIEELIRLNPQLSPLKNEDWLNLEMDDVDTIEGQKRIDNSQTNLLIKNAPLSKVNVDIASVSRLEMDRLYNEVSVYTTTDKKCVTGLIVHHAMEQIDESNYLYQPVFQPVFLKRMRPDYGSHSHIYNIIHQGSFYTFSGAMFTPCNNSSIRKEYYRNMISLKTDYDPTTPFRDFIQNTDTEFALLPFQLIYTLMEHNGNNQVLFHQCVSGNNDSSDVPLYHSVLLSSKWKSNTGLFAGKFANRSHLCPPCGQIDFGYNLSS